MKNKIIKGLTITLLSGSMALASTPSLASSVENVNLNESNYSILVAENNTLEDGQYNVSIQTLKEKSNELSMAGQYMNEKALLEVKGQDKYMTLTLTKIEWMKDIAVMVNGSSVKYDLVKKGDSAETATIRFKVPKEKPDIKFQMNVEPMGNARVIFRVDVQNDITKISGAAKTSNAEQNNKSQSTAENSEQDTANNKDGKQDNLPQTGSPITQGSLLGIGGLALVAGTMTLKKRS